MMRRPLIWFSAAFAIGCGLTLLGMSLPFLAAAIVLALSVIIGNRFEKLLPVCVLIAGLTCGLTYTEAYHRYITDPIADLAGSSKRITVTATGFATQYDNNQRVEVRINGTDVDCRKNFRTLVYLPLTETEIKPGDRITGKLEFYVSGTTEGFDRESYYRSLGYPVLASVNSEATIEVIPPARRPFSYYPKQFARLMQTVFRAHGTQRQAAFWSALTTGDRSGLTTTDTDHLRRAGLSHVIALSGLHIGFLISLLLFICGRRIGTALGIPTLIAFYLMVGWSPSVVRACIMYGIVLLSFWLRRQSDSMNSLFAALLLILIVLPDALTSVSLQLSFVSTFGILAFASRLQHFLALPKKLPRLLLKLYQILLGSVVCSICSTVFTAPILLYHFGYLSVFSVLSNLLALWAVSLVFPLLFLGGSIGIRFSSVAALILTPAGYLIDYVYWVSDWVAGFPYGILYCENRFDLCFAAGLSLIAVLLLWKAKKRLLLISLPMLLASVIVVSVWRGAAGQNDLRIAVLSEGNGQAIVVSCGEQAALIDCSGSGYHNAAQDVARYLDWQGIDSIDLMVITSVDLTHARNACELLHTIPVEHVILPEKSRENSEPYADVMQSLDELGILYEKAAPEKETMVGDASLGLSILGGVERKLAVRIQSEDQDILTVHALTQKMLLELTDKTSLECDTLMVSGGFADSTDDMEELLNRIAPRRIVLESGWNSGSDYCGIPIINPYYTGQIDWKTQRD